jgi:amino acid transporter
MQEKKKYGLFTTTALIIGMVVGSGIYIKNQSIIDNTANQVDALIA